MTVRRTTARSLLMWRIVQVAGVAATVLLIIGLVYAPTIALSALWNLAIPGVVVSLLITPHVWRNACPLATLNMVSNGWLARRMPTETTIGVATGVGMVLLLVLVPARRFLFNTDGLSLALLIGAIAIAALALGAVFDAKAGFCNTLCPVLPVERLFGQRPLVDSSNPRCESCSGCSVRGCIDLAPSKSIAQTLGPQRGSHAWMFTTYGVFAAAYPGLVLGYYLQVDGVLATAPSVYLSVVAWVAGSYLAVTVLVRTLRVSAEQAMPTLAAVAGGLYFWFASPVISTAVGTADVGVAVLRVVMLSLIAFWYVRALRQPRAVPAALV